MSLLAMIAGALDQPRVTLSNDTASDITFGGTSTASITAANDGTITGSGNVSSFGPVNWITPASAAGAAYEVRATVNSGSLTSGTTGSWLALDTSRTWSCVRSSSAGSEAANVTLEIRRASTGAVLDSADYDISAEWEV